ncbi:MAG TPA: sigma-70 family RNA polymerase sigma factor [Ktedonobacteraceae bacterium]|nr:sigma-70 family RNA polymerase sigma factor [Ktedonobacteraceae bacterium]
MYIHFSLRATRRVVLSLWPCLLCLFLPGLVEVVASRPSTGESEFQAFYRENLHLIYHYIYGKVQNREEAEDLTSQVFLKAIHHLDLSRGAQSKRSWLYQVARTTITDFWRSHYNATSNSLETLLEAGWEGPAENVPYEGDANATERVHAILEALPGRYREVLICRFLLGLSIKETAAKLDLSEVNVKTLQFRGLKRAAELEGLQ